MAGGWDLQCIGNYASGEPLGFGGSGIPKFNNGTNRAELLNTNGQSLHSSSQGGVGGTYLNTSLIKDPQTVRGRYAFGNAPRLVSQVRSPWNRNEDVPLHKNFQPFGEHAVKFRFRAELLNAFNRHRFDGIDAWPASATFGQIVGVSGNRQAQRGCGLISEPLFEGAGAWLRPHPVCQTADWGLVLLPGTSQSQATDEKHFSPAKRSPQKSRPFQNVVLHDSVI